MRSKQPSGCACRLENDHREGYTARNYQILDGLNMSLPWREEYWCRWAVRQRLNLYVATAGSRWEIEAETPQEGMRLGCYFFSPSTVPQSPCIRSQCTATTFPFYNILATTVELMHSMA